MEYANVHRELIERMENKSQNFTPLLDYYFMSLVYHHPNEEGPPNILEYPLSLIYKKSSVIALLIQNPLSSEAESEKQPSGDDCPHTPDVLANRMSMKLNLKQAKTPKTPTTHKNIYLDLPDTPKLGGRATKNRRISNLPPAGSTGFTATSPPTISPRNSKVSILNRKISPRSGRKGGSQFLLERKGSMGARQLGINLNVVRPLTIDTSKAPGNLRNLMSGRNSLRESMGGTKTHLFVVKSESGISPSTQPGLVAKQKRRISSFVQAGILTTLSGASPNKSQNEPFFNPPVAPKSPETKGFEYTKPEWLHPVQWHLIRQLSTKFPSLFCNLQKTICNEPKRWREYSVAFSPEVDVFNLPSNLSYLDKLQRILLLKIMKPECLSLAMTQYTGHVISEQFEQLPTTNLEVHSRQDWFGRPTVVFATPGSEDPVESIVLIAHRNKTKVQRIAIGTSDFLQLKNYIDSAVESDNWIIIENIHLVSTTNHILLLRYVEEILSKDEEEIKIWCTFLVEEDNETFEQFNINYKSVQALKVLMESSFKLFLDIAPSMKAKMTQSYRKDLLEYYHKFEEKIQAGQLEDDFDLDEKPMKTPQSKKISVSHVSFSLKTMKKGINPDSVDSSRRGSKQFFASPSTASTNIEYITKKNVETFKKSLFFRLKFILMSQRQRFEFRNSLFDNHKEKNMRFRNRSELELYLHNILDFITQIPESNVNLQEFLVRSFSTNLGGDMNQIECVLNFFVQAIRNKSILHSHGSYYFLEHGYYSTKQIIQIIGAFPEVDPPQLLAISQVDLLQSHYLQSNKMLTAIAHNQIINKQIKRRNKIFKNVLGNLITQITKETQNSAHIRHLIKLNENWKDQKHKEKNIFDKLAIKRGITNLEKLYLGVQRTEFVSKKYKQHIFVKGRNELEDDENTCQEIVQLERNLTEAHKMYEKQTINMEFILINTLNLLPDLIDLAQAKEIIMALELEVDQIEATNAQSPVKSKSPVNNNVAVISPNTYKKVSRPSQFSTHFAGNKQKFRPSLAVKMPTILSSRAKTPATIRRGKIVVEENVIKTLLFKESLFINKILTKIRSDLELLFNYLHGYRPFKFGLRENDMYMSILNNKVIIYIYIYN